MHLLIAVAKCFVQTIEAKQSYLLPGPVLNLVPLEGQRVSFHHLVIIALIGCSHQRDRYGPSELFPTCEDGFDLAPRCRVHQGPLLLDLYLSIPSGVILLRARNWLSKDKCEIVLSTECTSILSRIITAIEKNEKETISEEREAD
jgi:hypothetical protein